MGEFNYFFLSVMTTVPKPIGDLVHKPFNPDYPQPQRKKENFSYLEPFWETRTLKYPFI